MGEILRKLIEAVDDQFRGGHFVRTGREFHAQTRRLVAVKAAQIIVLFRTHFDGRDVAETHF
ncbi:hypothetical protein D3C76_1555370 [compost metagenome]